ncbi:hypothetical protein [Methanocella sp. MCL-LM]|uniref:hypothetical protein n=1 Tax=Methanocella sp. MCL-LM TaxID=3412035 RepID=UPI003C78D5CF
MADNKKSIMISMAFLALGLAVAVLGIAAWVLAGEGSQQWAISGVIAGLIMALAGAAGAFRKRPVSDERTAKLSAYAASWSWFSGVVVTSALFLLNYYGVVKADTTQALGLVLLTLLATLVAFNAYFRTRGDVA